MENNFKLALVKESETNAQGQFFPPNVLTWDTGTIALVNQDAEVVAFIDKISREEGTIWAEGTFAPNKRFDENSTIIPEISNADFTVIPSVDGEANSIYTSGRISGAQVITQESERVSLVASAIPIDPPKEWFQNPNLTGPTMLTVTPEGRVYGHVAAWGTCHVGRLNKCVTPPRSQTNYRKFNRRPVITADGTEVYAGPLTFGVGHASLLASAKVATEHYDNVDAQIGQICAGEDQYGIWFAGALNPDVDQVKLRKLRASAVSGDWRGSDLRGVLCVNIEGFPIPQAEASFKDNQPFALVAAGVIVDDDTEEIISEGDPEMTQEKESPTELTFEGAIADFASQLESLVEANPETEIAQKSQTILASLSEQAMPQEPEAEPSNADLEAARDARMDALEAAIVKIGTIIAKNA